MLDLRALKRTLSISLTAFERILLFSYSTPEVYSAATVSCQQSPSHEANRPSACKPSVFGSNGSESVILRHDLRNGGFSFENGRRSRFDGVCSLTKGNCMASQPFSADWSRVSHTRPLAIPAFTSSCFRLFVCLVWSCNADPLPPKLTSHVFSDPRAFRILFPPIISPHVDIFPPATLVLLIMKF